MTAPNRAPSPPEAASGRHLPDADLKAYADGELGGWGRLRARRHIARCSACREEMERMELFSQNLRAFEQAEPLNAALRARLIAAAINTPAVAPAEVLSPPLWRRQPLLTLGASGAIAAATLYLVVLPRPTVTPDDQQRGAAESASTIISLPATAPTAGAAFQAAPAVVAAAPPAKSIRAKAAVAARESAPRPTGYAATKATPATRARVASVAVERGIAPPPTTALRAADASAARVTGSATLLKNTPVAGRAAIRVPLAAAVPSRREAARARASDAAEATGGVAAARSPLSYSSSPVRERIAVAPPREVLVAVAPGQSAATREAVVALVRSAGGSFEETPRPAEFALGLDTARGADRRLDVRVAPERMDTLLADVARLNVQAVPTQAQSRSTVSAGSQADSVAAARGGRGAAKPAPQASGAPSLNSGGSFGGGGTPAQQGRALSNAGQNQAISREGQRAVAFPARAAVTIRIVEEAKAAPPTPAAPAPNNSAGQKAP